MTDRLEKHIQKRVDDIFGEHWPVVAWVTYAVAVDPETMTASEPVLIEADGQFPHVTTGLLNDALELHKAENAPAIAYAIWDEDTDEDG